MKKYLGGAVLGAFLAAPAMAADLPARIPARPAPVFVDAIYNWGGFYLGANGGFGWGRKCWSFLSAAGVKSTEGCHSPDGGLAGGQIGYNWQAGSWVFGIEAQGDWANLRGSNVSTFAPAFTNRSKVDAIALFTGRIGYAFSNVLFYVKGGGAAVNDKYDYYLTATGLGGGSGSETRWGGTVGTGLEFGFTPNWSAGVEYDFVALGTKNLALSGLAAGASERIRQDVHMFTARLNYRFGGPVVARY